MTTETVITLSAESLYTILGGVAGIAVGATAWITWRVSKLTERINITTKNADRLEGRITYIEQMKMQESQQIVQNFMMDMKRNMDASQNRSTN